MSHPQKTQLLRKIQRLLLKASQKSLKSAKSADKKILEIFVDGVEEEDFQQKWRESR